MKKTTTEIEWPNVATTNYSELRKASSELRDMLDAVETTAPTDEGRAVLEPMATRDLFNININCGELFKTQYGYSEALIIKYGFTSKGVENMCRRHTIGYTNFINRWAWVADRDKAIEYINSRIRLNPDKLGKVYVLAANSAKAQLLIDRAGLNIKVIPSKL